MSNSSPFPSFLTSAARSGIFVTQQEKTASHLFADSTTGQGLNDASDEKTNSQQPQKSEFLPIKN